MSQEWAAVCIRCPSLCAPACPSFVASGREDQSPRSMVLEASVRSPALGTVRCLDCGACESACAVRVPVRSLLQQVRGAAAAAAGLASGPEAVGALHQAWREAPAHRARTVVIGSCGCGAHAAESAAIVAFAQARGATGVVALEGVDCGRRLRASGQTEALRALAPLVGAALAGVRSLVVPSRHCARTIEALAEQAGLVAFYVSTVDNWLARFGVAAAAPHEKMTRFGPCGGDASGAGASGAGWPPRPTCCGAGEPFASAAPEDADRVGIALLDEIAGGEANVVHVEDALCRAHLQRLAARRGVSVRVVSRIERVLADAGLDSGAAQRQAARPNAED
ncbi:MAG: (Fe-S)-binding protein [Deltaproteobacteria bacterium]|nr:(Fe-S)-binding protein [Deltaproteobacteria bacterium]